jgi:hypothetical protein
MSLKNSKNLKNRKTTSNIQKINYIKVYHKIFKTKLTIVHRIQLYRIFQTIVKIKKNKIKL